MPGQSPFDQLLDPQRVLFPMPMAGKRVGASRGLDEDVRPEESRIDADTRHPEQVDGHFVAGKPGALSPRHGGVRDLYPRGEQVVPLGPSAGLEGLEGHGLSLGRNGRSAQGFKK